MTVFVLVPESSTSEDSTLLTKIVNRSVDTCCRYIPQVICSAGTCCVFEIEKPIVASTSLCDSFTWLTGSEYNRLIISGEMTRIEVTPEEISDE